MIKKTILDVKALNLLIKYQYVNLQALNNTN